MIDNYDEMQDSKGEYDKFHELIFLLFKRKNHLLQTSEARLF